MPGFLLSAGAAFASPIVAADENTGSLLACRQGNPCRYKLVQWRADKLVAVLHTGEFIGEYADWHGFPGFIAEVHALAVGYREGAGLHALIVGQSYRGLSGFSFQ